MSKLKQKRVEIIVKTINDYGIYYNHRYLISIWDLAYNINNTWNAKYFVNTKKYKSQHQGRFEYALLEYNISKIFRGIRHAVRNTHIALYESNKNRNEYLVKE